MNRTNWRIVAAGIVMLGCARLLAVRLLRKHDTALSEQRDLQKALDSERLRHEYELKRAETELDILRSELIRRDTNRDGIWLLVGMVLLAAWVMNVIVQPLLLGRPPGGEAFDMMLVIGLLGVASVAQGIRRLSPARTLWGFAVQWACVIVPLGFGLILGYWQLTGFGL
ncbi:hypothetical protein JNJ66_04725 [Candidatus Saccharibacteria bacterium]|nr:hypothetical protein [Candidatus Saccharibacteria bacterium]